MIASETQLARAVFNTAVVTSRDELGPKLSRVSEDLHLAEQVFSARQSFFFNPGIPSSRQIALITELFADRVDALSLQFLMLLSSRRRLRLISRICRRYDELCEKAMGRVRVKLRIPYAPSEPLLDKLRVALAEHGLYAKEQAGNVEFEISIDKSLIGGFAAEADGRVLDASLKTRLSRLRPGQIAGLQ